MGINSIPSEILPLIFKHIPNDLKNLAPVERRFHKAALVTCVDVLTERLDTTSNDVEKLTIAARLTHLNSKIFIITDRETPIEEKGRKIERASFYQQKMVKIQKTVDDAIHRCESAAQALRDFITHLRA